MEKFLKGLLLLISVDENDTQEDANWLIKKVVDLRFFQILKEKMNLSVKDVAGRNFMHQPIYFNLGLQKRQQTFLYKSS